MTQGFLRIATYDNAGGFLNQAQVALEQDEEENHLILGICRRMRDHSDQITTKPFLATIQADGEDVLAVMMTPPFPLVLARTGSTNLEVYQVLVDHLQREGWQVSEINGPEYLSTEFADLWAAKTGLRKQVGRRQRLYTLTQVEFPRGVSGELRKATSDDLTLVQTWGQAFRMELNSEMGLDNNQFGRVFRSRVAAGHVYLWDDDGPVSMAMENRPSRNGVAVSYVYTPPQKRRRGYASACVAALSHKLLADGYTFCALYTDTHNPTSNHIYQQVGYQPVSDFTSYLFA